MSKTVVMLPPIPLSNLESKTCEMPNSLFSQTVTPKVYPADWKNSGITFKHDRYIQYYIYDPFFKENYKNSKFLFFKKGSIVLLLNLLLFLNSYPLTNPFSHI